MVRAGAISIDTDGLASPWASGGASLELGWLHVASDALMFGAFAAIAACLLCFLLRRKDAPFPSMFYLFFAFLAMCGLTHLVDAVSYGAPGARTATVVKAAAAVVSWAAVLALVRALPRALELPALRVVNERLAAEAAGRQSAQRKLELARAELEARSSQLTLRDRRVRDAFSAALVGAAQWEIATGKFVWRQNVSGAFQSAGIEIAEPGAWEEALGHMEAARLRRAAERAAPGERFSLDLTVERPDGARAAVRVSGRVDEAVNGAGATATCMFRCLVPGGV